MEKRVRKNSKKFIIIEIVLIILIVVLCSLFLIINNKITYNGNSYQSILKSYTEKEKKLQEIKESLSTINKNISEYSNIDKEIKKTKDEYYKAIKQLEEDILSGKSNKKIAYMTFDDGPYFNTYKVLDILDRYGAKATFFTTTVNQKYYYEETGTYNWDLYKEYLKRGHTIANHTYTHAIFKGLYDSVDSFMDAVVKQENHIKEQTGGYVTNIIRFPGGSGTAGSLKYPIIEALKQRGYGWVDWTAHDGDGGNLRSTSEAWSKLKASIDSDIEVILFHDYCSITINMLPDIIEYLQNKGYLLLPLFYESNMINK